MRSLWAVRIQTLKFKGAFLDFILLVVWSDKDIHSSSWDEIDLISLVSLPDDHISRKEDYSFHVIDNEVLLHIMAGFEYVYALNDVSINVMQNCWSQRGRQKREESLHILLHIGHLLYMKEVRFDLSLLTDWKLDCSHEIRYCIKLILKLRVFLIHCRH